MSSAATDAADLRRKVWADRHPAGAIEPGAGLGGERFGAMAMTKAEMATHIDQLLHHYGLAATVGENRTPRGGRRRVWIKPVRSEITYLSALHEIAHALGKGNAGNRLHQEVVCWQWALVFGDGEGSWLKRCAYRAGGCPSQPPARSVPDLS